MFLKKVCIYNLVDGNNAINDCLDYFRLLKK